ncbi:vWA domain-containing protein [Chamaesiphon polymorphus]|uniref:VWA domain-containing protein n=1 Tax=Chamaesiphon polymorphus CCALA 037 TaxID=2107692 RepID=A0A2T1GJL2_9CYAN|nr:vWA domain-containing protein [Chamaesiphon polymorphus]PSB57985.1 VWA domain-containing protein [Chamaesiphon polymorphus CCALA 037]
MSNLVDPLAAIVQAASQLPDKGIAANYHRRIGSGNPDIRCLLLDTSGSMSMECKGKDRRIDVLRKAVEALDWQSYRLFTFDSLCVEIHDPSALWTTGGGTALDLGLKEIIKLNPSQTVVISDGEPNDEEDALTAVKQLTGTISTVFIGDDTDKDAIAFMRKLATLGCGNTYVRDLGRGHAELCATVQQLMLPPSQS